MLALVAIIALFTIVGSFVFALLCLRKMGEVLAKYDEWSSRQVDAWKGEAEVYRDQIEAMTTAIGKQANVHIVFPRRGPLELTDGWFDGKPRIEVVTTDIQKRNNR